jgi:hypothetical protein
MDDRKYIEETRFSGTVLLNLGQRTNIVNRREIELCQKAALFLGQYLQYWLDHIERMQDTAIPKKDVVWKAVCNGTKKKTKNEMAGRRVHGPENDGCKRTERQSEESRGLEAYCTCRAGQDPPRAVAPSGRNTYSTTSFSHVRNCTPFSTLLII